MDGNLAGIFMIVLTTRLDRQDMTLARVEGVIDYLKKRWDDGGLESAVKSARCIE
mgnify:FL=1